MFQCLVLPYCLIFSACLVEDPVSKRQTSRNYLQSLEGRVPMLEVMLQITRPDVVSDHSSLNEVLSTYLTHNLSDV
jgi:hypothetical protein